MIIAVMGMVSLGIGLIPAWATDTQKLPSSATIDKSKPLQPTTLNPVDPSKLSNHPGCVPKTCEQAGAKCGDISDGCGKVVHCGIAQQVSVTVDPPQYTGICPKTFKFTGTITTDKKGTAKYSWIHHPYVYKEYEVVFNSPGSKQVFFEWSVPPNLPSGQQWLELSACSSSNVYVSAKAVFQVQCTKVLKPGDGLPLDPKQ
jgi:hypothetical protein